MKRQLFLPILTAAVAFTSMVSHNVASAQISNGRLTESQIAKRELIRSREESDISTEEQAHWQALLQQQDFEQWLGGIELTLEVERSARTELARYDQALGRLGERAEAEEHTMTDAKLQAIEDEFSASLEQVLPPNQIQQGLGNFWVPLWQVEMEEKYFDLVFKGIRLIPVEEQFVRAEISYYIQVLRKLVDRAEAGGHALTDTEAQTIEDEFFANLKKGLRFEQMQQVQNNLARRIDAVSLWQTEILQQCFDLVFEGIELTPVEEWKSSLPAPNLPIAPKLGIDLSIVLKQRVVF